MRLALRLAILLRAAVTALLAVGLVGSLWAPWQSGTSSEQPFGVAVLILFVASVLAMVEAIWTGVLYTLGWFGLHGWLGMLSVCALIGALFVSSLSAGVFLAIGIAVTVLVGNIWSVWSLKADVEQFLQDRSTWI